MRETGWGKTKIRTEFKVRERVERSRKAEVEGVRVGWGASAPLGDMYTQSDTPTSTLSVF